MLGVVVRVVLDVIVLGVVVRVVLDVVGTSITWDHCAVEGRSSHLLKLLLLLLTCKLLLLLLFDGTFLSLCADEGSEVKFILCLKP